MAMQLEKVNFNLERQVNWWLGRVTDQELSDWTGMPLRSVRSILELNSIRQRISGGGRGRRSTRRLSRIALHAVAVIHEMNRSGLTFDFSAKLIDAVPFVLSFSEKIIDVEWDENSRIPLKANKIPGGPWLEDESVPSFFDNSLVSGELADEPDPYGLISSKKLPLEKASKLAEHLLICDGRWVFHQSVGGLSKVLASLRDGTACADQLFTMRRQLIAEISDSEVILVSTGKGPIGAGPGVKPYVGRELKRVETQLENFGSLIDINLTLPVLRMKRRAYGLFN